MVLREYTGVENDSVYGDSEVVIVLTGSFFLIGDWNVLEELVEFNCVYAVFIV